MGIQFWGSKLWVLYFEEVQSIEDFRLYLYFGYIYRVLQNDPPPTDYD